MGSSFVPKNVISQRAPLTGAEAMLVLLRVKMHRAPFDATPGRRRAYDARDDTPRLVIMKEMISGRYL